MSGWGWGKRKAPPTETELQRLARKAQEIILGMSDADRERAIETVASMFKLGAGLQAIPGEFFGVIGQIFRVVIVEMHMPLIRKKSFDQLLAEILSGADRLAADPRLSQLAETEPNGVDHGRAR